MQVTDVRIDQIFNESYKKAEVSVKLDNDILLTGILIVQGKDKLLVNMPKRRQQDGTYKDTFNPLNKEMRLIMENHIINTYMMEVSQ